MKFILLIVLTSFSAVAFTSCSTVEETSMEEERVFLKEKYLDVLAFAQSKACNDPEE